MPKAHKGRGAKDRATAASAVNRRAFLATSGKAVAAAAVVAACDSGAPVGTGGTVTVIVQFIEGTDAGTITVTDPSGATTDSFTVPLPAPVNRISSGSAVNVPEGTYRIVYTPPASHIVDSTTERDVVVVPGSDDTYQFDVHAFGVLNVTVGGIVSGTSPGTVVVNNMDGTPAGTSIPLSAPAGGQSTGSHQTHPVGNYRVVHSAPSGHVSVGGDNTEDVTVPVGGNDTAAFQVQASGGGGPPGTMLFASDWSTALGETTNAVGDGGRWTQVLNNSQDRLTVIPTTGLGFPTNMANCLAVRHRTSQATGMIIQGPGDGWGVPAIGEHRYFRIYWRNSIAANSDPDDAQAHPLVSRTYFDSYGLFHGLGATYFLYINTVNDLDFSQSHRWQINLSRDVTYRIEWHFERTGANSVRLEAQVFETANPTTPVRTNADFVCAFHNGHSLAAGSNIIYPAGGVDGLQDMSLGHEGDSWGPFADPDNRMYYGGLAVRADTWCGPYVPGEGP